MTSRTRVAESILKGVYQAHLAATHVSFPAHQRKVKYGQCTTVVRATGRVLPDAWKQLTPTETNVGRGIFEANSCLCAQNVLVEQTRSVKLGHK